MFDHIGIHVTDLERSAAFYDTVLATLGVSREHEGANLVEWGELAMSATDGEHPVTRNLHIGFRAQDRAAVDAFWQAGVDAGHPSDGEPGPRPQYGGDYYGAFLRDPDGMSVEAVHGASGRTGAEIDHLWIRVLDVAAAAAFYRAVAPFTGFAPTGADTDFELEQFASAQSSFAVVAASADWPAVSGLHLAFGATERATVDAFHAAALAAGAPDNGGPGERPQYHPGYYGAFALDPGGTNVEVVHHGRSAG